MLKYRAAVLVLVLAGVAAACDPPRPAPSKPQPLATNIVFNGAPGTGAPPGTLGGFTMTPFGPDGRPVSSVVSNVPDPAGTIGFTPSLQHRRIGAATGWTTWSHGYAGDVYFTQTAHSVTLTMPPNTQAFYFYAEPEQFANFNVTAAAQDGTTSGPISVNGNGGAKYFGFYGTNGAFLSSIVVSSADAFAVGEFGIAVKPAKPPTPPPPPRSLTKLSDFHTWIGLRNSDDQGTQFDVMTELLKNGTPVASGLTRCVTYVTRNPTFASYVVVPWNSFAPVPVNTNDVFTLRVSTRVGTAPNGTKCIGPGGSHNSAVGLRLYYDTAIRPSRFYMTISPDPVQVQYLHSDGIGCGDTETPGVTARTLNSTVAASSVAKCKDSGVVNFAGGNAWQVIGSWSMAPQP